MKKELNFFQDEVEVITPNKEAIIETVNPEEKEDRDISTIDAPIDAHILLHLKKVIEALLFASHEPLPIEKIKEVVDTIFPLKTRRLKKVIEDLKEDYISQQRAFRLDEIGLGYVLRSHETYAPYIELLYKQKRGEKISPACTEVLAIIAYKQPITRPQIDAIRGVDSSGTLVQLLERNLVEARGKLEAPGRPTLYGTTKDFLKHFGLKDIAELNPACF